MKSPNEGNEGEREKARTVQLEEFQTNTGEDRWDINARAKRPDLCLIVCHAMPYTLRGHLHTQTDREEGEQEKLGCKENPKNAVPNIKFNLNRARSAHLPVNTTLTHSPCHADASGSWSLYLHSLHSLHHLQRSCRVRWTACTCTWVKSTCTCSCSILCTLLLLLQLASCTGNKDKCSLISVLLEICYFVAESSRLNSQGGGRSSAGTGSVLLQSTVYFVILHCLLRVSFDYYGVFSSLQCWCSWDRDCCRGVSSISCYRYSLLYFVHYQPLHRNGSLHREGHSLLEIPKEKDYS